MPRLIITAKTSITQQQFLDALVDFGPERGTIWGNSQSTHLIVHELGIGTADITEGSNIFGGTWERLRYDWSQPDVIELRTTDSNIWASGSGWQYIIEKAGDEPGTLITATVTRIPNSLKGHLILIIFGTLGRPLIKRGFQQSLRAMEEKAQK